MTMNPSMTSVSTESRGKVTERIARKIVLTALSRISVGRLEIVDPDGVSIFGDDAAALRGELVVHDRRFYVAIALRGALGFADAFRDGSCSSPDLTTVLRVAVANAAANEGLEGPTTKLFKPAVKLAHLLRANTRKGSRKNISAHYDLSNDFFARFLDDTMTYSSAMFADDDMSLKEAQVAKLDTICRKLELKPSDHVVEIGTGWGSFALHAAENFGCRVTTTTISKEQFELANRRVREAGLEDRIEILFSDYRDLEGEYDKLVSIEMIEAVGAEYFDTYFETVSRLLKPDGLALIQAITIADRRFESARRGVDFIKREIFPGCCIPSVGAMASSVAGSTDLDLVDLEDFGSHYARTLATWRENLIAHAEELRAEGRDEHFIKTWEYYFRYCEAGFAERQLRVMHLMLAKPRNRMVKAVI